MKNMGEEMVDFRLRESTMREQLQMENDRLKEQLQEKERQLATMEGLVMEVTKSRHCKTHMPCSSKRSGFSLKSKL